MKYAIPMMLLIWVDDTFTLGLKYNYWGNPDRKQVIIRQDTCIFSHGYWKPEQNFGVPGYIRDNLLYSCIGEKLSCREIARANSSLWRSSRTGFQISWFPLRCFFHFSASSEWMSQGNRTQPNINCLYLELQKNGLLSR